MSRSLSVVALLVGALLVLVLPAGVTAASTVVRCDRGADLQAAIERAPVGAILDLRGTCRGDVRIDGKDLTLRGDPRATLRGSGSGTTLAVENRASVRLVRLAITGGGPDQGDAGITAWWGSTVTLRDCAVHDNAGNGLGGDVALIRLLGSRVRHNGGWGVGDDGYGLRVELVDSVVRRNAAGGVTAGTVRASRSRIARNDGPGLDTINQGLVWGRRLVVRANAGSGITSQQIDLVASTIEDNAGSGIRGGWYHDPGWVEIRGSIVRRNHTAGDGGGLLCSGGCTIIGSRFVGNTAGGDGGGIFLSEQDPNAPGGLTVRRSAILANQALGSGGGIHTEDSRTVLLDDVTFRHNRPDDCSGC